jgi:hypothetical protein
VNCPELPSQKAPLYFPCNLCPSPSVVSIEAPEDPAFVNRTFSNLKQKRAEVRLLLSWDLLPLGENF